MIRNFETIQSLMTLLKYESAGIELLFFSFYRFPIGKR